MQCTRKSRQAPAHGGANRTPEYLHCPTVVHQWTLRHHVRRSCTCCLTHQRLVWRRTTGWTVRGSNPRGDKIFRTHQAGPGAQPRLLYYTRGAGPLPGVKRSGRVAKVKERVELKLYAPSGFSWPVYRVNFAFYHIPFHLQAMSIISICLLSALLESR